MPCRLGRETARRCFPRCPVIAMHRASGALLHETRGGGLNLSGVVPIGNGKQHQQLITGCASRCVTGLLSHFGGKMKIELENADIEKLSAEITKRVLDSLGALNNPTPDDTVFTVETLAAHLQTTPKWVYNHIHTLPHFKIDGLLRFRKKAIDRLFEKNPSFSGS